MHMSQSCRFIKPKYDFFQTKKVRLFCSLFWHLTFLQFFERQRSDLETRFALGDKKLEKKKLFSEVVGRTHRGVRRLSRPLRQHLVRWKFRFFHRKVKLANPRIFKSDVSTFRRIYSFFSKLFFLLEQN